LRQAIRIRELKTQILNDVSNPITALILVEKAKAKGATTYEGRRVALRNYHTLLAKRIVALDGSLKQPVEADLYNKLRELEQRRVRPSVLIEPVAPVEGSNSAAYEPSR